VKVVVLALFILLALGLATAARSAAKTELDDETLESGSTLLGAVYPRPEK